MRRRTLDKLRAAILVRASSKTLLERLDESDAEDAALKQRVRTTHGAVGQYADRLATKLRVRAPGTDRRRRQLRH